MEVYFLGAWALIKIGDATRSMHKTFGNRIGVELVEIKDRKFTCRASVFTTSLTGPNVGKIDLQSKARGMKTGS